MTCRTDGRTAQGLPSANRTEYGVRLLAAASCLRDALGSRRTGPARDRCDADRATATAALSTEGFAELWAEGRRLSLREAAAYAGRLRGPRRRGVGWVSLTPAERQVADLAAEGLTNREIGDRLFSSPRTVQAHLSHVFVKLGINSRKMLAEQFAARKRQLPPRHESRVQESQRAKKALVEGRRHIVESITQSVEGDRRAAALCCA